MSHSTAAVKPRPALLLPVLPDDAKTPVRLIYIGRLVIALFSPAQEAAAEIWAMLRDLFGPIIDAAEVTA